ncbi:L-ribulokinase [Sphingobacterium allocomposti]|uniref:Ribulokinase n=1 Tax=Sphingobacterium allocomposti TaxID=415956 RepID=A0A5S5DUY8_9SPHI|nr:ribulokinase [Sphingobacterium composti Yoo et al. 2007 non Ten et al. 2007]TYP98429.1 L-ribulokinase [Sphingobacterium composti Yoo et al. 2007 non Ten et al. 2007]
MSKSYVIGVDYGSDSVRSVLVDAGNGQEISSSVFYYPRWKRGEFCDPASSQFRQHPLDYIEGLETTIRACLEKAGDPAIAKAVKAISVDTTGSTPVAVDERGVPLSLTEKFADNPNAMFVLWKDHTAVREAQEINDHAKKFDTDYLQYVGGIYSSEWFWAKLLHVLRVDEDVRGALYTWVEHCDYIPFLLTGGSRATDIKRSVCAAGHKSLWAETFGGLPPDGFFSALDPLLSGFVDRLFTQTYTSAEQAGTLSEEWAHRLGLSTEVVVGVGAFDCHMGAVGGQIEPYYLSKVMGTSTCDMLVAPKDDVNNTLVRGICGQVDGSIIPGMIGMEAGQSAFGDAYAWFKQVLMWPVANLLAGAQNIADEDKATIAELIDTQLIPQLSKQAEALPVTDSSELAIDWFNGRRTPDADQTLKGALSGLHLGTDAVRIFRSIVEATCFGAKRIVERFVEQGVPVKGLIGLGGVAKKAPFIMQTMADVINMPIRIHKTEQTCAIGAAMFAATAAGIYPRVEDAMAAMGQGFEQTYEPRPEMVEIYAQRYEQYKKLGGFLEANK